MIQLLIDHGHRYDDIVGKYSIDQIKLFSESVVRSYYRKLLDLTNGIRQAYHAPKNDWQRYFNQLKKFGFKRKRKKIVLNEKNVKLVEAFMSGKLFENRKK